jgi:tetratricopeptide (TPR) repeat protein
MKRLIVFCAVAVAALPFSLRAQPNVEANKVARQASEAAKDKDWENAVEGFRKATEMDRKYAPNFAAALQQRATAYVNDQRFAEAITDFTDAIKAHANASAYEGRAYVYMRMNDIEHALADYSEAIKQNPGEARLYAHRAHLLANKNDFKGTLADADKVLKMKKGDADAQALKKWAEGRMKAEAQQQQPNPPAPPPPPPAKKP